jgi:UDP-glucose 4-epimerase
MEKISRDNTIIVTGVAGLIGSNFVKWLLKNTAINIVGIDNLTGGIKENLPSENNRFTFYKANVEDDSLNVIFKNHKPKYVTHFSAWAAECASPFMRKHNVVTNMLATANVINNCINHNVKRLLFTSSMSVYGLGDGNPPFSEELIPAPVDSYAIAKYACEMDIKVAGEQHGLDWVIIRPHNVMGKGQVYYDRYRNVLGIWQYKYLQGLPITIFGDGEQKRSFSYIDDSIECFWNALIQKNCSKQIINLGGIQEYSIKEAANILVRVLEEDGSPFGKPEIIHLEPRHEVKYAYPTWAKSVDLLNFKHKTDLYDGLKIMWPWVKTDYNNHKRKQLTFDDYEVEKGIYSYWSNK